MELDWVTQSFTKDASTIGAHLLDSDTPWETIALHQTHHAPMQLLGIFPSYLQIDIRFYRAIRRLGMSSLTVPSEQMHAGIALVDPLHIGGIVLTADALERCVAALQEHCPTAQPYLQVVLSPSEQLPRSVPYRTYLEIHCTPGVPVLYQCTHLSGSVRFHPAATYDASTYPLTLDTETQACPCGTSTMSHHPQS